MHVTSSYDLERKLHYCFSFNVLYIHKSFNVLHITKSFNILHTLKSFNILHIPKSFNILHITKSFNVLYIHKSFSWIEFSVEETRNSYKEQFWGSIEDAVLALSCVSLKTINQKVFEITIDLPRLCLDIIWVNCSALYTPAL